MSSDTSTGAAQLAEKSKDILLQVGDNENREWLPQRRDGSARIRCCFLCVCLFTRLCDRFAWDWLSCRDIGDYACYFTVRWSLCETTQVHIELAGMKASSQLSQSLLGSLLIGEDDYNREVTWKRNSKSFSSQNVFFLNRWSSLEEERNSWKFVVRCSRGPHYFKTGHFTTLIGRERLWNSQKWETHVQSVQNNFFLVHMQIFVVLVTVHVVVAFATFWQRDDSEISSLKWFLLFLCR